jgi:hypothetical protein
MPVRRRYWWLVGTDTDGTPFLVFGSAVSEQEARQKGLEMLGGVNCEVKELHHRDMGAASHEMKGGTLAESKDIHKALRKLRHKNVGKKREQQTQANPFGEPF